jgi:hypothetical protein
MMKGQKENDTALVGRHAQTLLIAQPDIFIGNVNLPTFVVTRWSASRPLPTRTFVLYQTVISFRLAGHNTGTPFESSTVVAATFMLKSCHEEKCEILGDLRKSNLQYARNH